MPATDWKEVIPQDEPAKLISLAEQLREIQRKAAGKREARRGLHVKSHSGARAEFTVLPDLPEHARVGIFAKPATYRAWVRFSNGAGGRRSDSAPDQRGIAIKVLGVEGKKIIPGLENAKTQDFLAIKSPATPFKDADGFVWLIRALQTPALLLPKAMGRFGPLGGLKLIRNIVKDASSATASFCATRFFSALPIKYGPYAAKYSLEPHLKLEPEAKPGKSRDFYAEDAAARLAAGPVVFDFRVQFFVDEARTPIEDASKEWSEADAPFITVARLTLEKQDVNSPEGKKLTDYLDTLSFDPWHTTEDFRPLGAMMRARNVAYRLSTQERKAAPEPEKFEVV